jgi:archaellum component FlaC
MYPGDYIIHLEKQLQYSEEELSGLQYKYDDLEEEYDRLKTRSIMDFVEEVKQEQRANQELVKEAMGTVHAFKKENERLKEQIDMWGRLNQPERKLS